MPDMSHRVGLIVFDGFQLLDVTGPASVYGSANDALGRYAYDLVIASSGGGAVTSSCGVAVESQPIADLDPTAFDSVFLSGGNDRGLHDVIADAALQDWMRAAVAKAGRYGSICSGSLILAAWHLVGTRRFATHWMAVAEATSRWPNLELDPEAIYVNDGSLWTSAGVTTGIDMTLAIIEQDHGEALARTIAQRLVLSVRRPGWQSQFSSVLAEPNGRYAALIDWIGRNLETPISVECLAEQARETIRSFYRNFSSATGSTPAQFVMRLRIDRARGLISDGLALKQVARSTGFANVAQLSAGFNKVLGMTANEWRIIHS